ncbi:MAG: hypothetical protein KW806_01165 [Candidatus Yanofskybacteria bacterium]|nr:hypothetical protein [Candidatus Yanofskybacteria bacterium]
MLAELMPSLPEGGNDKKIILVEVSVAIFVLMAIFGLWYFRNTPQQVKLDTSSSSASNKAAPLHLSGDKQISESNPFQTDTNPLSNIYENPFE